MSINIQNIPSQSVQHASNISRTENRRDISKRKRMKINSLYFDGFNHHLNFTLLKYSLMAVIQFLIKMRMNFFIIFLNIEDGNLIAKYINE